MDMGSSLHTVTKSYRSSCTLLTPLGTPELPGGAHGAQGAPVRPGLRLYFWTSSPCLEQAAKHHAHSPCSGHRAWDSYSCISSRGTINAISHSLSICRCNTDSSTYIVGQMETEWGSDLHSVGYRHSGHKCRMGADLFSLVTTAGRQERML